MGSRNTGLRWKSEVSEAYFIPQLDAVFQTVHLREKYNDIPTQDLFIIQTSQAHTYSKSRPRINYILQS